MLGKIMAAVRLAPKRRSSPEMSSLAARIIRMRESRIDGPVEAELYLSLLRDAKRLAGSVLSQDELK